ncbi:MAG: capsule assembly Wzi family protein [Acidobacteriaceae bacterium]|nr:capsule assembly Wzi family protein [Acidobacteriaceae bacterium]
MRFQRARYSWLTFVSMSVLGFSASALAQTQSSADQPQSLPSAPAATPASKLPSTPAYQDPLTQTIPVMPGPPAATQTEEPRQGSAAALPSLPPYDFLPEEYPKNDQLGSSYIPVDSPIYPMALRLYSLGYLNTAFLSMRPWTRRSLLHMIEETEIDVMADGNEEAMEILAKLKSYLADEDPNRPLHQATFGFDQYYTRLMGISGQTLRDSYHLGQTIANDYGRPYQEGFNNITGFSSTNEWWRFSLNIRGEYQHSPSGSGYPYAVANELSCIDLIECPLPANYKQDTIPYLNTGSVDTFRLQEATLSFHVLGHEISGGKSDAWLGPGMGGAMAWSNNAENIYSFRINRVEPLHIKFVDKVLGPVRYDFFVGSLKGHTYPNDPWVHSEMFAFRPSSNFEFGFQRTVIWGGEGHVPITFHTFLRSFFDINDTTSAEKYSRSDPGARYSDFNFSYRLPFMRRSVTLYVDSIAHDDVSPISAPRRAAYRPGIYLSHVPGIPKLDLRVEAASTDTSTLRSLNGQFNYYEIVQRQGYTNKGFIMGDWIGREAKGGQAWLTYHLSGNEWVQLEYLNKKTPKDFIPGGTTQNQFRVEVVKRLTRNVELNAWYQYERWKAPVSAVSGYASAPVGTALYKPNAQSDNVIAAQFTWYPKLHKTQSLNGK